MRKRSKWNRCGKKKRRLCLILGRTEWFEFWYRSRDTTSSVGKRTRGGGGAHQRGGGVALFALCRDCTAASVYRSREESRKHHLTSFQHQRWPRYTLSARERSFWLQANTAHYQGWRNRWESFKKNTVRSEKRASVSRAMQYRKNVVAVLCVCVPEMIVWPATEQVGEIN